MKPLLAGIAAALSLSTTVASAINAPSVADNGNVVDTSFSTPQLLAIDIGFLSTMPVAAKFTLDVVDVDGAIGFNSILSEISGGVFQTLSLRLSAGATFVPGGVEAIGGSVPLSLVDANGAHVLVTPRAGIDEIYLGDPLATGASDWSIGFSQLAAGDTVTLTITPVPEPSAFVMLICGLGILGSARRYVRHPSEQAP